MSGIAGIVNMNGAPVSRDLLARMAAFLRFRGPDAQNVWCDFAVGFAHALLDTSLDIQGGGAADKQPCSIDGRVWIVADARIDALTQLNEELRSSGITVPVGASDAEIILLAYQAWGKDCVHHLIGDFAFAIWDGPGKQLFRPRSVWSQAFLLCRPDRVFGFQQHAELFASPSRGIVPFKRFGDQ